MLRHLCFVYTIYFINCDGDKEMLRLNRYEIKEELDGNWAIIIKCTNDLFQDGFTSKQEAIDLLEETFG